MAPTKLFSISQNQRFVNRLLCYRYLTTKSIVVVYKTLKYFFHQTLVAVAYNASEIVNSRHTDGITQYMYEFMTTARIK